MKNGGANTFTSVHQSLTFSRRMLLAGGAQAAFGALLIGRLGWLSVAENGVALSSLLQSLVDGWRVEVRRLALVGHSMGGLIARAACAVASGQEDAWTGLVSDVVTLGTPHLGADLALGVSHGSRLLAVAPEAAAFGRFLDHRSPGIRDLERGLPGIRDRHPEGAAAVPGRRPAPRVRGRPLLAPQPPRRAPRARTLAGLTADREPGGRGREAPLSGASSAVREQHALARGTVRACG